MSTLTESEQAQAEAAGEVVTITGPADWVLIDNITTGINMAFILGSKELYMYISFMLLWLEGKKPATGVVITMEKLKQTLGQGFQHPAAFRKIRRRLERLNLLKVIRRCDSNAGRGGSRNVYMLTAEHGQLPRFVHKGLFDHVSSLSTLEDDSIGLNKKVNKIITVNDKALIKIEPKPAAMDGVEGWEAAQWGKDFKPRQRAERGCLSDDITKWSGAHRFNYFMAAYKGMYNTDYVLSNGRGLCESKMAALPCSNIIFKDLIDWLVSGQSQRAKLKSINFLPEQLNTFYQEHPQDPDKKLETGIKGEFFKVPYRGGEIAVVHQYVGQALKDKKILALDAVKAGLITPALVLEWGLCPPALLERMGYKI